MYRYLQFLIIFTILSRFVMLSIGSIYNAKAYVATATQQGIDLIVFVVLLWAFRLRRSNPFASGEVEAQARELPFELSLRQPRLGLDLSAIPTLVRWYLSLFVFIILHEPIFFIYVQM